MLTFLGTVDDCVERAPFGRTSLARPEPAKRTLIRHALFGNPMVIHSGFLVNNTQLRRLVVEQPDLIFSLIEHGRIVVLSKTGDIAEDEILKARNGVATAQSADIDEIKRIYDPISNQCAKAGTSSNGNCRGFLIEKKSPKVSPEYIRKFIMSDLLDRSEQAKQLGIYLSSDRMFQTFRAECLRLLPTGASPRTAWQEGVKKALRLQDYHFSNDMNGRQLMALASEIFHIAMTEHIVSELNIPVSVETNYSLRLQEYIPYKPRRNPYKSGLGMVTLRFPISLIERNSKKFFDYIFCDHNALDKMEEYLENPFDKTVAISYERCMFSFFGIDGSLIEREEKLRQDTEYWASIGIATADVGAAMALHRYFSKINRRELMIGGLGVAGLFGWKGAKTVAMTYAPAQAADSLPAETFIVNDIIERELVSSSLPDEVDIETQNAMHLPTALTALELDIGASRWGFRA